GTAGRPTGLVHTTGGYLTQTAYTHALLFDLVVGEPDTVNDPRKVAEAVHWCTADLAWVTAHTYEIYGPLLNGVTQVIYEGTPQQPHAGRHFEIIERHGVTTYYTAPTLVRSHMGAFGSHPPAGWSAPSASPSTPGRGRGCGARSAPGPLPSSTRGGSRRPVPASCHRVRRTTAGR